MSNHPPDDMDVGRPWWRGTREIIVRVPHTLIELIQQVSYTDEKGQKKGISVAVYDHAAMVFYVWLRLEQHRQAWMYRRGTITRRCSDIPMADGDWKLALGLEARWCREAADRLVRAGLLTRRMLDWGPDRRKRYSPTLPVLQAIQAASHEIMDIWREMDRQSGNPMFDEAQQYKFSWNDEKGWELFVDFPEEEDPEYDYSESGEPSEAESLVQALVAAKRLQMEMDDDSAV